MRAIWFVGRRMPRLVEIPTPVRGPGQVLVKPHFIGLCGTDLELLDGTLTYFASGDAGYPLQPGHEWAGTVVESDDLALAVGTRVVGDPVVGCGHCERCSAGPATHCADRFEMGVRRGMPGAAAELVAVPAANLHPIPVHLDMREAVLAEPSVTVLAGIDRWTGSNDIEALVIGAGTLGLIATSVLASKSMSVSVAIRSSSRVRAVEEARATPILVDDTVHTLRDRFSLVIEASGTPEAVNLAVAAARSGGTVVLLGLPPQAVDGVDVSGIVLKDLAVHGIINGPGRYGRALDAIAARVIPGDQLIDRTYALEDAAAALDRLRERGRERPKVLLETSAEP